MINLVVALLAEAKPLIRTFNLKLTRADSLYRVYMGKNIALVLSGVGKINSAAACAFLSSITDESEQSACLNIGIAGHAESSVGEGLIASRIIDAATSNSWYPSRLLASGFAADTLLTVDVPQVEYSNDTMYDMEASGFYTVASKLTTCELVQSYKVISDNREHSTYGINAIRVEQLITDRLEELTEFIDRLQVLSKELNAIYAEPDELKEFVSEWHFSVTQRHRLKRLITCLNLRSSNGPIDIASVSHLRNSREVLNHLEKRIEELPVQFPARSAKANHTAS